MKNIFVLAVVLIPVGLAVWYVRGRNISTPNLPTLSDLRLLTSGQNDKTTPSLEDVPVATLIAQGLDTPWGITFLPDGSMLVTERKGTVRLVSAEGELQSNPVATLSSVKEIGEGGLLGIVLHPSFAEATEGK